MAERKLPVLTREQLPEVPIDDSMFEPELVNGRWVLSYPDGDITHAPSELREIADWLDRANGIEPKRPLQWRECRSYSGQTRLVRSLLPSEWAEGPRFIRLQLRRAARKRGGRMADAPRILGVPMRQCENPIYYKLEGVRLCRCADGAWWYWQVHIVVGVSDAGTCDTLAEAQEHIERAITRIREAARKLGT